MGSPSRNVQYHPPRLSEDRLNLPQPHSPSLPTHCTAPGNRECARRISVTVDMGVRLQRRRVDPHRLSADQTRVGELLQHPGEDRLMRFETQQSPRP